jgi:ABC-2 type transport system permease protein
MRLFLSNLKMSRGGLIAWGSLIFLYGLFAIYLYPTVSKSTMDYIGYIASMPEALRAAFGLEAADISGLAFNPDTFVAVEFFIFWPVIVCFFTIFNGVSIAREVERGTMDLLLAQPISRMRVLLSRDATILAGVLVIALVSWLGVVAGMNLINTSVNLVNQALVIVEASLFVLAIGSYTVLASVIFLEPRKALMASGALTAIMYIINFIVPVLSPSLNWMRNLSFFYHYNAVEIVSNGALNWTAVTIFLATIVLCTMVSVIIFKRRDLSA